MSNNTCTACGQPLPFGSYVRINEGYFHLRCLNNATGVPGASTVPAGWRLVPVEPTDEMLVAGQEAWMRMRASRPSIEDCKEAQAVFDAMLLTAPEPPQ